MGNLRHWLRSGFLVVVFGLISHSAAYAESIPAQVVEGDYGSGSCVFIEGAGYGPLTVSSLGACLSWADSQVSAYLAAHPGSYTSGGWYVIDVAYPNFDRGLLYCGPSGCLMQFRVRFNSSCSAGSSYNASTKRCEKLACPDSSWALNGQTCTRPDCPLGTDRDASGQCVKDCTGKQGQPTANGSYEFGADKSNWSVGGCKVACSSSIYGLLMSGSSSDPESTSSYTGVYYVGSGCVYTGASASAETGDGKAVPTFDPNNAPPSKPQDCLAKGQGYIQGSNGVTCVPASDAPQGQKPDKVEEQKVKESGTPGANGQPDPNAPDYTKTETKSTTGADGKTTTTTTETRNGAAGPNGGVQCPEGFTQVGTTSQCQKVTTETQDTKTFCQENPKAVACSGESSTFSGNCTSGFVCTGDEANCAAAKAAYELKCAFEKSDSTSDFGKGLIDGNDPDGANLPNSPNAAGVTDLSDLPYTDVGGSCPPDWAMNIMGRPIVISTAKVCDIAHYMGMIGVALSLLAAAYFVYGGIK